MDSSKLGMPQSAFMADFVQSHYPSDTVFNDVIAGDDEMFKAILRGYVDNGDAYLANMQSGRRMLDVVDQLTSFGFESLKNTISLLEFACGYGRLTRHLAMEHSAERIVVSDIYRAAVDWQHSQHRITGVYSTPKPDDFALVGSFDMIFVGSLFSHLPKDLFRKWLARLYEMLSPKGIIAFSVHDTHLIGGAGKPDFVFKRRSESGSLSKSIYGTTYVSEGYVADIIATVTGSDSPVYRRYFKGLYENQDLYVLPRSADSGWLGFELRPTPVGGRSYGKTENGRFFGGGWALDLDGQGDLSTADLIVGGALVAKIPTELDTSGEINKFFLGARGKPVRFRVDLPLCDFPQGAVVKCRFRTHPDYSFDVYLGCI